MPIAMGNYVQSVAVQGRVYVGGGDAEINEEQNPEKEGNSEKDYMIMEYDIASEKWMENIQYKACYFAMTAIAGKLVLVGGYVRGWRSNELGVWDAGERIWTNPYPNMRIARSRCSAVVFKDWLVAIGGWPEAEHGDPMTSVEVMNIAEKKWYAGPSTPKPCFGMTAAVVKDVCYLMGGYISEADSKAAVFLDKAYTVSLSALIQENGKSNVWMEIPSLHLNYPTPLAYCGSLLAVGGVDKKDNDSSLICLYKPETGQWVPVGNLPAPRRKCSCEVLEDGQILVAGGNEKRLILLKTVDILSCRL